MGHELEGIKQIKSIRAGSVFAKTGHCYKDIISSEIYDTLVLFVYNQYEELFP